MDETYGTYVDDECFDIHNYDDDTHHDTDDDTDYDTDDDTNDATNDDTDDGGRGNLYTTKVPGCCEYVLRQRLKQKHPPGPSTVTWHHGGGAIF